MSGNICRWGFLSTAGIGRKNWQAILHSGNGRVTAVASRSLEPARSFIDECQAEARFDPRPVALSSYEELLTRHDVDAVYIPLPTGLRKEWVIRAAEHGKHVLCEKPCAIDAGDLQEMVDACKRNGVQFMDGVMFMHSERLKALRETIDDGQSIGNLKRIETMFSFRAPDDFLQSNIRVHSGLEPAGCLGDLGWYTIRFTLWVMRYQTPLSVRARMLSSHGRHDSPDSVPMEFSAEMLFEGGVSASFYCSFLTQHQQWAHVTGENGNVMLADFVLPYCDAELHYDVNNAHFDVRGCQFVMERRWTRRSVREYANNHPTAQETRLFRNFSRIAMSEKLDPHWPRIALETQRVLDACLRSARDGGKDVELGQTQGR